METADFVVIGAGVVGLTIARELQRTYPDSKVLVLEKEPAAGQHASGRNSGVLHSGIYYTADSLKARFTRQGNIDWHAFCDERRLPIDRCGKLVVAQSESDQEQLQVLADRGAANGVQVQWLDEAQVKEVELSAVTHGKALLVPSTSTVDARQLVEVQVREFTAAGGVIRYQSSYLGRKAQKQIRTNTGNIDAGYLFNCAGLYADRIAHDFGFGKQYTVLPFKGLYLYPRHRVAGPRTHIYPVPDLRYPFLGVHLTRTMDGSAKIGPTAIPALWREQYGGTGHFSLREMSEILRYELKLAVTNRNGFLAMAWQEFRKRNQSYLIGSAEKLMRGVRQLDFTSWGKPGIRAQLYDRRHNRLEMDFVLEGDATSLHVLNAVSPAFTCAMPIARHVVQYMNQLTSGKQGILHT